METSLVTVKRLEPGRYRESGLTTTKIERVCVCVREVVWIGSKCAELAVVQDKHATLAPVMCLMHTSSVPRRRTFDDKDALAWVQWCDRVECKLV